MGPQALFAAMVEDDDASQLTIDAASKHANAYAIALAIVDTDWSIYDTQLTVYLTPWPRINKAIRQFGRVYDVIARGQ